MGHEKSFMQGGCQRGFYSLPAMGVEGCSKFLILFFSADALTGVVSQFALTPGGMYCPSDLLAAACSSPILMGNLLFTLQKVHVPLYLHACLSPRVFRGKVVTSGLYQNLQC